MSEDCGHACCARREREAAERALREAAEEFPPVAYYMPASWLLQRADDLRTALTSVRAASGADSEEGHG